MNKNKNRNRSNNLIRSLGVDLLECLLRQPSDIVTSPRKSNLPSHLHNHADLMPVPLRKKIQPKMSLKLFLPFRLPQRAPRRYHHSLLTLRTDRRL